jgi:3-keto-L-gulonate-6-phosphate decarboxylase
MMQLQISYDFIDLEQALMVARQTAQYADILEVGSLLLFKSGIEAVVQFKKEFPSKKILVDAKLVDRVKDSVTLLSKSGADYITVLAGAPNSIIRRACQVAHDCNTQIALDLMDSSSIGQSSQDAKTLGVDSILYHKGYDIEQNLDISDAWSEVAGNTTLPVFIAGHVQQPEEIEKIIALKPAGLVIGRAITSTPHPAQSAQFFREKMG